MANKTAQARKQYTERQNKLKMQLKNLKYFDIAALCAAAVAVLCFFFDFAQVHNSSVGVEVHVSGMSFALAALTGGFTSTSAIYGNIAVPFNYYAESYSVIIGALALTALFVALAVIALHVAALLKPGKRLAAISIAASAGLAVLLIACFAVGLAMNDSDILPIYCSGNPACSIRSYAIIAAIVAIALTVLEIFTAARYWNLKDMVK